MSQPLFYLAMGGLDATMQNATAAANNLANRATTGYKAERPVFRAVPLYGAGLPDRVAVSSSGMSTNFAPGSIGRTGRNLDVAVNGPGWIAVQAPDGSIGFTRDGALAISQTGVLETNEGYPVIGRGNAPIVLPPLQRLTIAEDGTISGTPRGQSPDQVVTLNRILLANPPAATLQRRGDGLFEDAGGAPPTPDGKVRLEVGALEGSNSEPVSLMLSMIENTRTFEMQTEMVRNALNMGQGQGSVLTLT